MIRNSNGRHCGTVELLARTIGETSTYETDSRSGSGGLVNGANCPVDVSRVTGLDNDSLSWWECSFGCGSGYRHTDCTY